MKRLIAIFAFILLGVTSSALGQANTKLVILHLRGGLDPLATVQPVDSALRTYRPYLYRGNDETILLSTRNGVLTERAHDNFPELVDAMQDREAVVIHGVGYNSSVRSPQIAYNIISRGVSTPNSSEKRGWLQRAAIANGLRSSNLADLSAGAAAFAGGQFEPVRTYGTDNLYRYSGDYRFYYDSTFQLNTIGSVMDSFPAGPAHSRYSQSFNSLLSTSTSFSDVFRSNSWPPQGNNDANRYAYDSFGYRLREAEMFVRHTGRTGAKVIYIEVEGFDTARDQRRRLESRLDDLNDAIQTFRRRLTSSNQWQNVIVAVITDGGRTVTEAGKEPDDGRVDRAYGVGTNFGGVFDVYIFSGALRRGGLTHGSYTHDQLLSRSVPQRYHIMDIYSELLEGIGYSPNGVFEPYSRKRLALF